MLTQARFYNKALHLMRKHLHYGVRIVEGIVGHLWPLRTEQNSELALQ